MISQVFVLSASGEVIAFQDFRFDVKIQATDKFFEMVKEARRTPLDPVVEKDGVKYFHILRENMYFVATSVGAIGHKVCGRAFHVTVIEILKRFYSLCKDFCGVVSEESMRTNCLLVHEILGQLLDYGYVQLSTTDKIKPLIMSEVRTNPSQTVFSSFADVRHSLPSTASNKPVVQSRAQQEKNENEIFVDVVEKLLVIFNPDGTMTQSEITGEIQMKCFVIDQPTIKMGLNDTLMISEGEDAGFGSAIHISDVHFHENVSLDEFSSKKALTLHPPDGQFTVMNYHVRKNLPNILPFQLFYTIDSIAESDDMEVTLRLRCNSPATTEALKISAHLPVPKSTSGFMQKYSGPWQMSKFDVKDKKIIWDIKKLPGGSEATAKFRLLHGNVNQTSRSELGPLILVDFEISAYVCSNMQIRFLKVTDQNSGQIRPRLWVRYVTVCNSYTFKLNL